MADMLSFTKDARAQRLQKLRATVKLPVRLFKKYGIAYNSFRNWEKGEFSGLSESGAIKLSQICNELGYNVSVEWLLFGIGQDPFCNKQMINDRENAEKELKFFHHHLLDSIDTLISDDALAPWYQPGDIVAGKCLLDNAMEFAIGFPSIVKTQNNEVLVRIVHSGNDIELYNLECSNPNTTVNSPMITDVKLLFAAPILWSRRVI